MASIIRRALYLGAVAHLAATAAQAQEKFCQVVIQWSGDRTRPLDDKITGIGTCSPGMALSVSNLARADSTPYIAKYCDLSKAVVMHVQPGSNQTPASSAFACVYAGERTPESLKK
ncbi:hypothetical protein FHP25_28355 [Vineibacter terrae]|uniref:Uncharacterized protein n=1 Tax=Vineibacter terrae TaxID=2586908 RepID=A0A5C8PEL9_9HYPH|nr:hypothetical protein [Vineibacter terrae]TXL71783.1 hypothetical protein FHP25_28355 [Vineibacter terrae]